MRGDDTADHLLNDACLAPEETSTTHHATTVHVSSLRFRRRLHVQRLHRRRDATQAWRPNSCGKIQS